MSVWGDVKRGLKKVVGIVTDTVKKIGRSLKDFFARLLGVFDFLGSLVGIRPKKYLRFKVYILSKKNAPIKSVAEVQEWLDKTKSIFKNKMNIELRRPNLYKEFIDVITEDAPDYALNPPKPTVSGAFSDAVDYYEENADYSRTSTGSLIADMAGYGDPVFAFVVEDIDEADGGVYWLYAKYSVISSSASMTTMAHELCHSCGLADRSSHNDNLMSSNRNNRDTSCKLTRWQISVVRNSRYVVYTPRRG